SEMPAFQAGWREGRGDEARVERASQELDALADLKSKEGGVPPTADGKLLSGQFAPFGSVNRNLGVNNAVSGLTPSGALTPDLNVPVKNSSFDARGYDVRGYVPGRHATGEQVPDGGKVQMGGFGLGTGTMGSYGGREHYQSLKENGVAFRDGVVNSIS